MYKYEKGYLTEKKSQVSALAEALGLDIDPKNPGLAFSKDKKTVVVQLQGHTTISFEPQEYMPEWGEFGDHSLYIFPDEFKIKMNPSTEKIFLTAKKYLMESENIFIATDSDCEGGAIAMNFINMIGVQDRVQGMIPMGSVHAIELRKAVNNYKDIPYLQLAASGIARANLDWVEGISYSRAGSYYLGNKNKVKLPYGGVMTPTIALVVNREIENTSHVKRYFYTVSGYLIKGNNRFECSLEKKTVDDNGKASYGKEFETEEEANEAIKNFINIDIKVESLTRKESRTTPGQLYELGALQIDMYNNVKASLSDTMNIGQKLYDVPIAVNTYVRTDSVYLKDAEFVDVPEILKLLKSCNVIDPTIIDEILSKKIMKRTGPKGVFYNEGVVAHGAIVPVLNDKLSDWLKTMTSAEKYYYMIVAKRYVSNFMDDYKYMSTKGITEEINDCRLVFSENTPLSAGWKVLYDKNILSEIESCVPNIPKDLKAGDTVQLDGTTKAGKKETKPRPYFTLATLLSAMIKVSNLYPGDKDIKTFLGDGGIGTNATREKIIEKILTVDPKTNDRWLIIDSKEKIRPTKKAMDYIKVLPEELTSPLKRAILSKELKAVEKGEMTKDDLLEKYRKIVKDNISIFNNIFLKHGPIADIEGYKPLGKCPICSKDVVENGLFYVCTGAKYDSVAKINNGCEFKVYKKSFEKLGKAEITAKEMSDILGKKEVFFNLKKDGREFKPKIIATEKGLEFVFAERKTYPDVDLGACPVCGAGVYEKEKLYLCSGADIYKDEEGKFKNRGCDYKILKAGLSKFSKNNITPEEVTSLLKNKYLDLKGLTGSKGEFDCRAIIDNTWGLKLDFDSTKSEPAKSLGKCPICKDGDMSKRGSVYVCSNGKSSKQEDGTYVNSGCEYKIYETSLKSRGKASVTETDIKKLLSAGSFQASLTNQKGEKYSAKLIVDLKYGLAVDMQKK